MKNIMSNTRSALILTPALFIFAFWILVSSSGILFSSLGLPKSMFWALLLSFGAAYSITLFVKEIEKYRLKN